MAILKIKNSDKIEAFTKEIRQRLPMEFCKEYRLYIEKYAVAIANHNIDNTSIALVTGLSIEKIESLLKKT